MRTKWDTCKQTKSNVNLVYLTYLVRIEYLPVISGELVGGVVTSGEHARVAEGQLSRQGVDWI